MESLTSILIFPIIITIIVFIRHVVGIRSFDIATNLITGFVLAVLGIWPSLLIFLVAIISPILIKFITEKIRLLYFPRMAFIIITSIFLVFLNLSLIIKIESNDLSKIIFLLMFWTIIFVEKFSAISIQKGQRTALKLSLGTFLVAFVCYPVFNSLWLQGLVVNYPFWVTATILFVCYLLGKWGPLKVIEYWQFREVIKRS